LCIVTPLNALAHDGVVLQGIAKWLNVANQRRAPGTAQLCMSCETEFTAGNEPAAFAVAVPFANHSSRVMVTGICCSWSS
jgi:hypothetical protein